MSGKVPRLDISLSADNIEDVVNAVMKCVRPDWDLAQVHSERLNKGLVNLIVVCHLKGHEHNKIFIKTLDDFCTGSFPENRTVIEFVHELGFGADLLCFINNGLVTGHTIGDPLVWNHPGLSEGRIREAVARQMAQWHQRSNLERARQAGVREMKILWGTTMQHWDEVFADQRMDSVRDRIPSTEQLLTAEAELREELLARGELEPAFIHGDVNGSNIAPHENGIQIIDNDFTGICYSQIDIAWYFLTFINLEDVDYFKHQPDEEHERIFLKHYLDERRKLDNLDKTVDRLYSELQKAKLFICLRYAISGPALLYLHNNDIFLKISMDRWEEFKTKRERVVKTGVYRD